MTPYSAITETPSGGIVVLVGIGRGDAAVPLIRLAKSRGVRVLCTDPWRRALQWIERNASDCYGAFTLFVGAPADAARAARKGSIDAVVYLVGSPTEDERSAWLAVSKGDRILEAEAA